jgi:hypothetical protein
MQALTVPTGMTGTTVPTVPTVPTGTIRVEGFATSLLNRCTLILTPDVGAVAPTPQALVLAAGHGQTGHSTTYFPADFLPMQDYKSRILVTATTGWSNLAATVPFTWRISPASAPDWNVLVSILRHLQRPILLVIEDVEIPPGAAPMLFRALADWDVTLVILRPMHRGLPPWIYDDVFTRMIDLAVFFPPPSSHMHEPIDSALMRNTMFVMQALLQKRNKRFRPAVEEYEAIVHKVAQQRLGIILSGRDDSEGPDDDDLHIYWFRPQFLSSVTATARAQMLSSIGRLLLDMAV